jgi:hypothetical protein
MTFYILYSSRQTRLQPENVFAPVGISYVFMAVRSSSINQPPLDISAMNLFQVIHFKNARKNTLKDLKLACRTKKSDER